MSSVIHFQEWLEQSSGNQEKDGRLFLTEEEVRAFPQFKDVTDEEVKNIICTLHDLALITYEIFCKELNEDNVINKAA